MTHKGAPHKRASKEELDKRRKRQAEVEQLKKRKKDQGTKFIPGKGVTEGKKGEFRIGFGDGPTPTKEEALESLERGTRFSDVKEFGITGPEFGARKRELFAEEHPIEKGLLDAASLLTLGLLGGKIFAGVKVAAVGRGVFQTTLSGGRVALATRFATNTKSIALTKSWLVKLGITSFIVKTIADLYGTYPFASFGKEETLQSVSFPISQAIKAGDLEGAQNLLDVSNEIINATPTIADKIPYVNVQKEFQRYIETQTEANEEWQRIIDIKTAELTGEKESDFAKERRESDEAAREREVGEREEDTAFFEEQKETQRQEKLREQELDSEYFRLIREKKFDEAEELLQSRIKGEA